MRYMESRQQREVLGDSHRSGSNYTPFFSRPEYLGAALALGTLAAASTAEAQSSDPREMRREQRELRRELREEIRESDRKTRELKRLDRQYSDLERKMEEMPGELLDRYAPVHTEVKQPEPARKDDGFGMDDIGIISIPLVLFVAYKSVVGGWRKLRGYGAESPAAEGGK